MQFELVNKILLKQSYRITATQELFTNKNNNSLLEKVKPHASFGRRYLAKRISQSGICHGLALVKEIYHLSFAPGKLTLDEYFKYRLDDSQLPLKEKESFASETVHWQAVENVCDPTYNALVQDKFICCKLLRNLGFPVPEILAVISTGPRLFPDAHQISTPAKLSQFLETNNELLFFKLNQGIGSYDSFIVSSYDGKLADCNPYGKISARNIFNNLIQDREYLVQKLLINHDKIASFANALSTVRFTNYFINGRVITPMVTMKIATGENIADNFWRNGNLLADIDTESGRIKRVIDGEGPDMSILNKFVDTDIICEGYQIPFWNEIVELNKDCARSLTPIPFLSLDVAVTNNGPIIIEVNSGGSFYIPQLASGKGFLTPQIRKFLRL